MASPHAEAIATVEAIDRETARRAGATDAVAFAKTSGFVADTWQARVLRSKSKRILLNCCRQAGKSTVLALRALHRAIYTPKSLVLIVAPSWRQSAEVLRKVQDFLTALPTPVHLETDSKTEVSLRNGSRIVSLPAGEAKIRGFSAVTELILDESGDVPDELYHAVLPMLIISRGTLLAGGTPKGRRGFFFESWDKGGDGWDRIEAPWTECPRMDAAEIAIQRTGLRERFAQEFECQFVRLSGGMVYASFAEDTCCIDGLPIAEGGVDEWRYMLSIDFGFVDATAFVVLAWRPNDPILYIPVSFKEPGLHADDIAVHIQTLRTTYPFTKIIGDIGGYGKGPAMELQSRYSVHIEPAPKTDKAGYIDLMNAAFSRKTILIVRHSNVALIEEIVALPWNDTRTNHADGYQDHLCFVAGTMVQTPDGEVPIESLRVGDGVMTRNGPRDVVASAPTGERRIWSVETTDGRELYGTADHPVFTEERGFCKIDSLLYGDSLRVWEQAFCRPPKSSCFSASDTGDTRGPSGASCVFTSLPRAGVDCTARYGSTVTDPSRLDTSSITRTKTRSTTLSIISSASPPASICAITCESLVASHLRVAPLRSRRSTHRPGMHLQPAGNGTLSTGATCGPSNETSSMCASFAATPLQRAPTGQMFAPTGALPSSAATAASTMSNACAPSAVQRSCRTSMTPFAVARDRVLRVQQTERVETVYALTIAGDHEYFANGILVSNCDALLYGQRASTAYLQQPKAAAPVDPVSIIRSQTAAVWARHEEEQRRTASDDYDIGATFANDEGYGA